MPSSASARTPSGSPIAPMAVVSSPGMTFACTPAASSRSTTAAISPSPAWGVITTITPLVWRTMKLPHKMLLLALAALMLVPATAPAATKKTTNVTVMTRNLYLGADIISLATASDRNDFEAKATALFQTVTKTDFKSRSALIAAEIKKNKPDFIGLQEVALWRRGADGVKDGSATPATTVVYDWVADLKRELKARKLKYRVVKVQPEFDFEGPTSQGYDIRFTQQDAILVRVDKNIKVKSPKGGNFAAGLQVPLNAIGQT